VLVWDFLVWTWGLIRWIKYHFMFLLKLPSNTFRGNRGVVWPSSQCPRQFWALSISDFSSGFLLAISLITILAVTTTLFLNSRLPVVITVQLQVASDIVSS
jgi:hypothetical protein